MIIAQPKGKKQAVSMQPSLSECSATSDLSTASSNSNSNSPLSNSSSASSTDVNDNMVPLHTQNNNNVAASDSTGMMGHIVQPPRVPLIAYTGTNMTAASIMHAMSTTSPRLPHVSELVMHSGGNMNNVLRPTSGAREEARTPQSAAAIVESLRSIRDQEPRIEPRHQVIMENNLTNKRTTDNIIISHNVEMNNENGAPIKRSRYLREADRRNIIRRIDQGEKQAALAKEFGVTRAAICHINKNRVEILTRSSRADVHSSARHPKRGFYNGSKSSLKDIDGDISNGPIVYEIRSHIMSILMTRLRRKETIQRDFCLLADRAMRILLEEALGSAPVRSIDFSTSSDMILQGLESSYPSCGISIGEAGFPLLEAFRGIQPDSPTGFVSVDFYTEKGAEIKRISAPSNLHDYNIFLMDTVCTSSDVVCSTIRALLQLGALERSIFFTTIISSARVISDLCSVYPNVKIITASIDPDMDNSNMEQKGFENFLERYYNTQIASHNQMDLVKRKPLHPS